MRSGIAAEIVVLVHFGFILLVVFGGLLVLKWPKVAWVHLPAVVWGAAITFGGWICPLTPLENALRLAAGEQGYAGGFIEQYLLPVIYPAGLTRTVQVIAGIALVVLNLVIYAVVVTRSNRRRVG